jgi:SAM-dependent methyltransferase
MDPSTKEQQDYYDDLARNGPYGTLAPRNRGGRKSRYIAEVFDAALLPLLQRETEPVRLLDFGCGTGIFSVRARPLVKEVIGVDLSPGLLGVAREHAHRHGLEIPFIQADGAELPLRDHAVNRVLAREVLCAVPDKLIGGVLAELNRVLEPNGRFYLLEQISENPSWQNDPREPLVKKRGVDEILGLFKTAGFELEYVEPVRQPRFPWIYPVWFGIVPKGLVPTLARWEVEYNRRFCALRSRRWLDALFVFRKR